MRYSLFLVFVAAVLASGCGDDSVTQPAAGPSLPLFDDFEDGTINPNHWSVGEPEDTKVEEVNGRLEMTLLGSARGSGFSAKINTVCRMTGDYDIQVDFEVLDWPASNGVRMGLAISGIGTERVSFAQGEFNSAESYAADHWGSVTTSVTDHLTGTLRAVRTGNLATSYYKDGNDWIPIKETSGSGSDTFQPTLMVWSHDGLFIRQDVRVAFDNFRINSGTEESCD